ncbi:MAG: hypothetical protein H6Q04_2226, partial [Acidobacteria bacterium]|nr:hypothetical protein [Acidobacteriota bacterium]
YVNILHSIFLYPFFVHIKVVSFVCLGPLQDDLDSLVVVSLHFQV